MIFSSNYSVQDIYVRLRCFQEVPVTEERGQLRWIVVFDVTEEQFMEVPFVDGWALGLLAVEYLDRKCFPALVWTQIVCPPQVV